MSITDAGLCHTDKLLMKLKLEQESKLERVNISGSSLMPVKDMFAVDTMTSQQLRIVKYTATKLLIGLLADQSLVSQVMLILPLRNCFIINTKTQMP